MARRPDRLLSDEWEQLELFRALPGDLAPRDAQDLMSYPFFSLAKSKRLTPIDFRMGEIVIKVEATPEHGMATIWDADVLIWAASQIVQARDNGLKTSRLMAATPYEILTFIGRATSARDYQRLKAALDRLQSTSVATSIRQPAERRRHRFSWINEWKETSDANGRPLGVELILPDWFYAGVLNEALVLTIDREYFALTGGLERWLYRLVRKHGGRQGGGWSFDFRHLHAEVRRAVAAQTFCVRPARHRTSAAASKLPALRPSRPAWRRASRLRADPTRPARARFRPPRSVSPLCGQAVKTLVLSGTDSIVPSGTKPSCYRGPKWSLTPCYVIVHGVPNCTNIESFGFILTDRAAIHLVDDRGKALPERGDGQSRRSAFIVICRRPKATLRDRAPAQKRRIERTRSIVDLYVASNSESSAPCGGAP